MSITRERLSPEESRAAALEAARRLLIAQGPQAVTLKAVAGEIGKTHANLLHHFGSAAGLQAALAASIGERVSAGIAEAVTRSRAGEVDPIEIVDRTFDAFGREGAGALAAWMILSGNRDALNPILESIHRLVDRLGEGHEDRPVHETTLWLVLAALGDSLLGVEMADALGLPRGAYGGMLAVLVLALAGGLFAQSQATTGVIEGTVFDPEGGVLPGATVTLTNTATNYEQVTATGTVEPPRQKIRKVFFPFTAGNDSAAKYFRREGAMRYSSPVSFNSNRG